MPIDETYLYNLTSRLDITEVVSRYVTLTKRGGNLFGICPFHNEKTASFSVSPDKQIYHCFGCGAGGGVIGFFMRIENLGFADAVRALSEMVGLTMPDFSEEASIRRKRLLALNRDAARFFVDRLLGAEGENARLYTERRRITPRYMKRFGLGYAPKSWDSLIRDLTARGYEKAELLEAGLVAKNSSGGIYDRFRDRLIFPIIDVRGDVVAFGGRALGDDGAKYLNSPETPVFSKSRNLFALNLAKKTQTGKLILAEGYMDVLSLHQAGFSYAVASLGTSLTGEQAKLMERYAGEVIIAYDSDGAGSAAAERAADILSKTRLSVRLISLGDSKDPDEFITRHGANAFQALLDRGVNHIEHRLGAIRAKHDLSVDAGRVEYLKEAVSVIASVPGQIERDVYAGRVAEMGRVPKAAVLQEAARESGRLVRKRKRVEERVAMGISPRPPGTVKIRYEDPESASCEEMLLSLLIRRPEYFDKARELVAGEDFSSVLLGRLFTAAAELFDEGVDFSPDLLIGSFTADEISHMAMILQRPPVPNEGFQEIKSYADGMRLSKIKKSIESDEDLLKLREILAEKKTGE